MSNLSVSYFFSGRHAEALKLSEETLAVRKRVHPPDHPDTLNNMTNLATNYASLGRHADSLKLREEVLATQKRVLPPNPSDTLVTMNNLAMTYSALDRQREAVDLSHDTITLAEGVHGIAHPQTLFYKWTLVELLFAAGRSAEAVPVIDECVSRAVGKPVDLNLVPEVMKFRLRHFKTTAESVGCRATAEMWEKLNRTDNGSLYNAACFRAVTAAVQAKTPGADAARLATEDADRAMVWLPKAIAAGYKDRAHIEADKDLDALRGRADFQKLLASLLKEK